MKIEDMMEKVYVHKGEIRGKRPFVSKMAAGRRVFQLRDNRCSVVDSSMARF